MISSHIQKYNQAVPRYTSYPTVPMWEFEGVHSEKWLENVGKHVQFDTPIALYVHLPYCESLCTYCGCNKRITRNHGVEKPYVDTLLAEWDLYAKALGFYPKVECLHFGGGTPTFFSEAELERLIQGLTRRQAAESERDFSIEIHPGFTRKSQLELLKNLGFSRLSVGVQDFDPVVQRAINRPQSFKVTEAVFDWARDLGYHSINADMVYGLPFQNEAGLQNTLEQVQKLAPDRIAYYSYAHVPWKSKGQRHFTETDIPDSEAKMNLFLKGKDFFHNLGYKAIGMDHFSLPEDSLYQAFEQGKLHRNFMGYTHQNHQVLLGLGASSISETPDMFVQNEKEIENYQLGIYQGFLPLVNGHILSNDDKIVRSHVTQLMCNFETHFDPAGPIENCLNRLFSLQDDGLVEIHPGHIKIQDIGKPWVRNICHAIDLRLHAKQNQENRFSKAV